MYDNGALTKLPASADTLRDRAVAHNFIRGEYIVQVETTNTTIGKLPIHSVRFLLNTQEQLWYVGSNQDEDGHRVHVQTATPTPIPSASGGHQIQTKTDLRCLLRQ